MARKSQSWFDQDGVLLESREEEFQKITRQVRKIAEPYVGKLSWRDLYDLFKDAGLSAVGKIRCDVANGIYKLKKVANGKSKTRR